MQTTKAGGRSAHVAVSLRSARGPHMPFAFSLPLPLTAFSLPLVSFDLSLPLAAFSPHLVGFSLLPLVAFFLRLVPFSLRLVPFFLHLVELSLQSQVPVAFSLPVVLTPAPFAHAWLLLLLPVSAPSSVRLACWPRLPGPGELCRPHATQDALLLAPARQVDALLPAEVVWLRARPLHDKLSLVVLSVVFSRLPKRVHLPFRKFVLRQRHGETLRVVLFHWHRVEPARAGCGLVLALRDLAQNVHDRCCLVVRAVLAVQPVAGSLHYFYHHVCPRFHDQWLRVDADSSHFRTHHWNHCWTVLWMG